MLIQWLELGKSWKNMENPSINKEFVAAMVIVAEFLLFLFKIWPIPDAHV